MTDILAAAKAIAAARRNRTPLQPLAADVAPQDEADGYRIQDALHDLLAADFGALVGYKIGCTSAVMQQYLDIPHPCGGGVFANGVHRSGVSLPANGFRPCRRRMRDRGAARARSCAIGGAVHGGRGRRKPSRPICRRSRSSTTATSTGRASARRLWWRTISSPPAACSAKPVARSAAPDLLDVIGRAVINGVEAGRGTGADVLGHPHHALAWLANHLAADGKALRAGQIVLTGSLVKTVWLKPGDRVMMELSGLGTVQVSFA